jgi:hypothetical protein
MDAQTAAQYFIGTFTGSEREFLFTHPDFQAAMSHSTEDLADLKKLNTLGVKLLLASDQPSAAKERPAPPP